MTEKNGRGRYADADRLRKCGGIGHPPLPENDLTYILIFQNRKDVCTMTKREMFERIASLHQDEQEIVEFCNYEISLLDKHNSYRTPTKTQKENEKILDVVLEVLGSFSEPLTVTELISTDALSAYSNQKISALLRKLIADGKVVKIVEGKKSRFALA